MKEILNRIKKDKKAIIIALVSLAALIVGSIAIGFIETLLIVILIDTIFIIVSKPKKKKKISFKEVFKTILIVGFSCAIFVLLVGIGFGAYIIATAPDFKTENLYNKDASILYAYNGDELVEIAKLGTEIRQKVKYDELSQSLIDAIIATEDSRYFQHSGVDLPRFIKASISQVLGAGGGGASTLTMQVSKNAFTSTEDEGLDGIIRKFSDIYISVFKIETHYTKEEILEFYVNSYYLGGSSTGVEQASLTYFDKSASELNIAEAAMIAGLFQAPVAYDPYINPEACENRRQVVLSLMLRHGYINEEEYNIAKELTVDKLLVKNDDDVNSTEYQDFIDTVIEEVIDRTGYDPYSVPMKIYTTMDFSMQDNMNGVMDGTLFTWKNDKVQSGAIVIDVNTGAIKAVGAGRNRVVRGNNWAVSLNHQIGSTAKPLYDYGPAIEYNNWSTYTPLTDEPYAYSDGTKLKNWNNTYDGFTTLHQALKDSRNIPALKAFQAVNNSNIKEFVTSLGLSPEIDSTGHLHEAHSLGGYNGESPITVAAAYAAFSNGGYYIEPHSFTKVEFVETDEIYEVKPITRKAMSSETAYMITKVLEDTSSTAIGYSVNGVNYAAKTGTTNLSSATIEDWELPSNAISDKWIASFNDSYAIAVWYGYERLDSEYYLTTNDYSIKKEFQAIAKAVYTSKSNWTQPNGVVKVEVESYLPTAMLASENTPKDLKFTAYFKKGFEPTETSKRFTELNNVTNLNYDEATNTLSWTGIDTPQFLDSNYITGLAEQMFTDKNSKQDYVKEMLKYNEKNVGTIVYDVYAKDELGNLILLTTTSENSFVYPIINTTTFVVKTHYTIFQDNISSGAEFTIEKTPAPVVTSEINGESTINILIGETYQEPKNPIIVLENGITDVTSQATITYTISRNSDGQMYADVSLIDTSIVDSYTITYNITYKDYNNTLTKIIKINAS